MLKELLEIVMDTMKDREVQEYFMQLEFAPGDVSSYYRMHAKLERLDGGNVRYEIVQKPNGFKNEGGIIRVGCNQKKIAKDIALTYQRTMNLHCRSYGWYFLNGNTQLVNGVCAVVARPN